MDDERLDELIHAVDLDGLVRLVDDRCSDRDWAGVLRLRDRCAAATRETGRQLWPAATLADPIRAIIWRRLNSIWFMIFSVSTTFFSTKPVVRYLSAE